MPRRAVQFWCAIVIVGLLAGVAGAATTLLLFLPMATPEVVLGAGLAAQFLSAGIPKGLLTIIIAHTMFCISFVVVTVRARVATGELHPAEHIEDSMPARSSSSVQKPAPFT